MTIPQCEELYQPIMEYHVQYHSSSLGNLCEYCAKVFDLSDDDKKSRFKDARETVFESRVKWARTCLVKAGLLERWGLRQSKISFLGREITENPDWRIDNAYLMKFPSFQDFMSGEDVSDKHGLFNDAKVPKSLDYSLTPYEMVESGFEGLGEELMDDLIQIISEQSRESFTRMVIDLLKAMGYGDSMPQSMLWKQSPYGGADILMHEDALGFSGFYCYAVQEHSVDELVPKRNMKWFMRWVKMMKFKRAIYITSGIFTEEAREYAEHHPEYEIVLIDGRSLAYLLCQNEIGVKLTKSYEIKHIDLDYFNDTVY